jgi:uncharacterized protein (DUF433 family)
MNVDWSECGLVERVAGKVGGRPAVKGTRIEPDSIIQEQELGRTPEQTRADFPTLTLETILEILAYAQNHQLTA